MANKDGNSTPGLNVIGAVMALRTIGSVIKGGIKGGAAGMPGKVAKANESGQKLGRAIGKKFSG